LSYTASSLSDLKEIGCKSVWTVHISPLFRAIERLLAFKIVKICPRPVVFSLRFFKSDRLLVFQAASRYPYCAGIAIFYYNKSLLPSCNHDLEIGKTIPI
jgi:hypothetical protein